MDIGKNIKLLYDKKEREKFIKMLYYLKKNKKCSAAIAIIEDIFSFDQEFLKYFKGISK